MKNITLWQQNKNRTKKETGEIYTTGTQYNTINSNNKSYPDFVASYGTQPGIEVHDLFYSSRATHSAQRRKKAPPAIELPEPKQEEKVHQDVTRLTAWVTTSCKNQDYCKLCSHTGSPTFHHHLQSEFWTSRHLALSKRISQQCQTPSWSLPQQHRSYESVRCHLFLQAPTMAQLCSTEIIQQRPLLLRKVLPGCWGQPLSGS